MASYTTDLGWYEPEEWYLPIDHLLEIYRCVVLCTVGSLHASNDVLLGSTVENHAIVCSPAEASSRVTSPSLRAFGRPGVTREAIEECLVIFTTGALAIKYLSAIIFVQVGVYISPADAVRVRDSSSFCAYFEFDCFANCQQKQKRPGLIPVVRLTCCVLPS